MQYQEAVRLGMLHRQLGIPANARIFLQVTTEGTIGAFIWDLETGNTYVVVYGNQPIKGHREVPQKVKRIMSATDDDLKKQWLGAALLDPPAHCNNGAFSTPSQIGMSVTIGA